MEDLFIFEADEKLIEHPQLTSCCVPSGEYHLKINEGLTLIYFKGVDYVDIVQDNSSLECGEESVTVTKDELVSILSLMETFNEN